MGTGLQRTQAQGATKHTKDRRAPAQKRTHITYQFKFNSANQHPRGSRPQQSHPPPIPASPGVHYLPFRLSRSLIRRIGGAALAVSCLGKVTGSRPIPGKRKFDFGVFSRVRRVGLSVGCRRDKHGGSLWTLCSQLPSARTSAVPRQRCLAPFPHLTSHLSMPFHFGHRSIPFPPLSKAALLSSSVFLPCPTRRTCLILRNPPEMRTDTADLN